MNLAQHLVYSKIFAHKRLIILKSRQQGISTLWLVSFFDDCVFNDTFSSGLMAQGAQEAKTLLERVKILWDELDQGVKDLLRLRLLVNNTSELSLSNGSHLFVRTSFRSTTLQRLHISEFGKIANDTPDQAREVLTGTLQAISKENIAIIESTAEGENLYKSIWDKSVSQAKNPSAKDFYPVFIPWTIDPDCAVDTPQDFTASDLTYFRTLADQSIHLTDKQKNFWVAQYRELTAHIFSQYPATPREAFLKNRGGTYYASLYLRLVKGNGREMDNLYDPGLPVQVAVDLGMDDFFVLLLFQTYIDGFRIIDEYTNSGEGIQHYCDVLKELPYNISLVILPHDGGTRELGTGKTREEAFHEFGFETTRVLPRSPNLQVDIEIVRQHMGRIYIDKKAQYLIDCFLNYTKKWDKGRQLWGVQPVKNKHAHGADAIRYMILGGDSYVTESRRRALAAKRRRNTDTDV